MREFNGGVGPVAIAAYAAFLLEVVCTLVVLTLACVRLAGQARDRPRMASHTAPMTMTTATMT